MEQKISANLKSLAQKPAGLRDAELRQRLATEGLRPPRWFAGSVAKLEIVEYLRAHHRLSRARSTVSASMTGQSYDVTETKLGRRNPKRPEEGARQRQSVWLGDRRLGRVYDVRLADGNRADAVLQKRGYYA